MTLWDIRKRAHGYLIVDDPVGWNTAMIWSSGIVDFTSHYNVPMDHPAASDNKQELQIYDIDEMISMLQEIKTIAQAHFGEDWGKE